MKMQSHSRALACVALALALGACSQSAPRNATTVAKPAAPKAAVVVPQQDPDAVVQSAVAEPSPVFDEEYHGPAQGSLESVTALFARGYIESAMRETMLAAVHSDYPLLGMRDVRLTDPVAKFLTSAQARTTAHDYLYAGVQRRLGRPLSPAQWEQIWQGYPQQGRVSDWVKQTKRVLAGR
ncbi:hypothetical protein RY45_08655 [Aeromonas hydrophila]|uniref:hypothetical protein n=1 Tax=Aeromonas hydrophila TaxID=644 RepID=UPI0005CE20F2|nr:hypothetical protein [Aeromonas hydrophila]AJQ54146.1 hypothetical protein RY45_08655 [Aeromonas hydrophila]MDX2126977.1 hypothetical protein [Aeromonas hydrophila]